MSSYIKVSTPGTTAIATTGDTDEYVFAPKTGKVAGVVFSSLADLATDDTNYITFSITNLGQAGSGSTAILAAANTTMATGGSAIAANTKRTLTLSSTAADLAVTEGDRLLVRFSVTGEIGGAVTRPIVQISIKTSQR